MQPTPRHTPEDVLTHLAWVQRLALRLCSDPALAEDVSQEAVLAAFRRPPNRDQSLRAWLGGVVRNQLRMTRRGASRRHGYEQTAAQPEALPSADELVARVGIQRQVVDEVMALPETYRTVLLQRYFDELTPTRIAQLSGLSPATVKTRLRRALAQLRERLDDGTDGAKGAWLSALLPLANMEAKRLTSSNPAAPLAQTAGWSVGALVAAAVVLGTGLAGTLLWVTKDTPAQTTAIVAQAPNTDPTAPSPKITRANTNPAPATDERLAIAPPARNAAATAAATAPPSTQARIHVLDLASKPVPNAMVSVHAGDFGGGAGSTLGTTNETGVLTLEFPAGEMKSGRLEVETKQLVTVLRGTLMPFSEQTTCFIVVAGPRALEGRVTAPDGRAIAGASVTCASSADLRSQFDVPIDQASRRRWTVSTDTSGAFAIPRMPDFDSVRMVIRATGYEDLEIKVPSGDWDGDHVLQPLSESSPWFHGVVLDDLGVPAPGSYVSQGFYAFPVDAQGRFQLSKNDSQATDLLQAAQPGSQPGRLERPESGWPPFVELRLGGPALELSGKVVDAEGQPRAGVRVTLHDATFFGFLRQETDGADPAIQGQMLETYSAGPGSSPETAADGTFRITGLLPKSYSLLIESQNTLESFLSEPLQAGTTGLRLVFPHAESLVSVRGLLVDETGSPIPGASVTLARKIERPAGVFADRHLSVPAGATEPDGTFALDPVQASGAQLHVYAGPGYAMRSFDLADFEDLEDLRVTLPRSAGFFVDLGEGSERADKLTVEDADGNPMPLLQVEGTSAFTMNSGTFSQGRSAVYRVPGSAMWLVLTKQGEPVVRHPLKLEPGQIRRIDL